MSALRELRAQLSEEIARRERELERLRQAAALLEQAAEILPADPEPAAPEREAAKKTPRRAARAKRPPGSPRRESPAEVEILGVLRGSGPASQRELGERTGIDSGGVSRVCARLRDAGKIERVGEQPRSSGGRPSPLWARPSEVRWDGEPAHREPSAAGRLRTSARPDVATAAALTGSSSQARPSSSRPPAFGTRPPHCLKKKAVP